MFEELNHRYVRLELGCMSSGGVPGEDFDMQTSMLTAPGDHFWFWSAKFEKQDLGMLEKKNEHVENDGTV